MYQLMQAGDLTGDQMRKLSGDLAYAQRGLDSVNNVASRGGLAWTAQIGIADAFGNSLRSLGPAGSTAAQGLRAVQMGLAAFGHPLDLTNINIQGLLKSISRLTIALPLLGAAAGTAAVGGLWRMNAAAAEMATDLEVAAHRTGLSVEALQEYHYAAEQAGIGTERFNTVAQRLLRRAADAQAGSKGLAEAFNTLGVSVTGADGKLRSAEELLGDVADGLFRVENQGERVALAFRLMDTDGSIMLNFLSAGSEGLAEMRREARELGLVISGDTIMTLSEFGNQVGEIKRQFEVARTEIAAAFLPVLQESVIPFIQDVVIPWLHGAANQVMEFADSFTEIGGAGADFRADMLRNMQAVIEFGRTVGVVVQSAVGALQTIAAVGGAVGGFIAGAADAQWMADRRAVLDAQISFLEEQLEQANLAADARRAIVQELNDARMELADLPANWWESAVQGMDFGWDYFFSGAVDSFSGALDLLERDLEGEISGWLTNTFAGSADRTGARNFGADLADGVADGITSGLTAQAQSLSDVVAKMQRDLANAATREAHNIAAGMDEAEAAAIRLSEELTATQQAYNTLLTGTFDRAPGDGLLLQLRLEVEDLQTQLANLPGADTAATWAARLGFEMAEGLKTPIQVIRILSPRLQELIAERDELLTAGRYNTTAYEELEADIQAITTTVEAAETAISGLMSGTSFPQPDEGEGLSELARQAYNVARAVQEVDKAQREALLAAERNSKVLAAILSRNVGATTPGFQPPSMDEGQGSEHTDVWLRLREDMKLAEAQASALGDQFDLNAAQSQAISRALTALLAAGVDPLSVGVQNLVADLADLAGAAEAVGAAEEAQKLLESLTEQVQQTTDARSATEQLRDALIEYGEANADAADEVAALIAQLDEFTAAEAAGEAQEQFEALLDEIEGIAREADQFSDLAARVEEVATAADLSEDQVSQLHAAIADAEARTEVQELADAVTDAEDRIRSLTGTGETEFSVLRTILETARDELLKLGEDVTHVDALLKQLGEAEAASNLTTALGTVRGAFQQIGSAAGGALGEAITGMGDMIDIAMKFASGDVAGAVIDIFAEIVRAISEVINANENWRRSLDDLAARNKMLSKDVTDAIVVSRDETVRLWGWLPIGTKKVVEQAATDQAIGWANAFANAAASALARSEEHTSELQSRGHLVCRLLL